MNYSMLSFLAGTVPNPEDYPVPDGAFDKLLYGLQVTLLGLGTVFFVLLVLMAVVYIFRLFFYTIPKKREQSKKSKAEISETGLPEESIMPEASDSEEEIAAVIAAAIASVYDVPSAQARQKYKIKSFKRI